MATITRFFVALYRPAVDPPRARVLSDTPRAFERVLTSTMCGSAPRPEIRVLAKETRILVAINTNVPPPLESAGLLGVSTVAVHAKVARGLRKAKAVVAVPAERRSPSSSRGRP